MNTGLSKRAIIGECFDQISINTYCLKSKKVVHTGSLEATAKFVGTYDQMIFSYLKSKSRYKKKYCFRIAKENPNP